MDIPKLTGKVAPTQVINALKRLSITFGGRKPDLNSALDDYREVVKEMHDKSIDWNLELDEDSQELIAYQELLGAGIKKMHEENGNCEGETICTICQTLSDTSMPNGGD